MRPSQLPDGLDLSALHRAFTTTVQGNWHPLTLVSHMIDVRLFGLRPAGHHLANLLFHACNVLLLFLLMLRMTSDTWRSALVAAVFSIHPLQVESVAWVAERKNMLSAFFCLLSMWHYAAYVRRASPGRYVGMSLCFAAALMSKATAVILPGLFLLLDYWPLQRLHKGWRRLVLEKLPLFALAAAAAAITLARVQLIALNQLPFIDRLNNACIFAASYLSKAVWPSGLSEFYPYPRGLDLWKGLGCALLLVGISSAAVKLRRARPYLLVGWLWFLAALFPMLGLLQVGMQSMADRYAYVPVIGLAVMVAWAIPRTPDRRARGPALAAAGLVAILMVAASLQVRYWRDDATLFGHSLRVCEDDPTALAALGLLHQSRGSFAQAGAYYRRALKAAPGYADIHNNLGAVLAEQGNFLGAEAQFQEALRLPPGPEFPGLASAARENLSRIHAQLELQKAKRRKD
ncbi:MAG: tetratricopeptide repeat protein [Elusimicrobia bacterium]|nr:tetratricopeptide repeat protein [Elusimicrobiota bacterium]